MNTPSILNDVIGPVMRGPSSSHSAGAVRIGTIARDLIGGQLKKATFRFDLGGSLPTTYISQGSDMGLCGGLLGFPPDDERLINYKDELKKAGVEVEYIIDHFNDSHPNTYNVTLENDRENNTMVALSTGGGMIEVTEINGVPVSYLGDRYAIFIKLTKPQPALISFLESSGLKYTADHEALNIFATRSTPLDETTLTTIQEFDNLIYARPISPVLSILTSAKTTIPFSTAQELEHFAAGKRLENLSDIGLAYEAARGGTTIEAVLEKTCNLIDILEKSIQEGLAGTTYNNRILGFQSGKYGTASENNQLFNLGVIDRIIPYVTALMEVKSAMGVIVAAPTAGSCGGLPGAVIAIGDTMNASRESKARGLIAGGLIGVLIAAKSTFAAEVCGCQAECGVSSGMIAGAMVAMAGGDYHTSLSAASLSLQNIFGMVCDPVANRVEVPCLGKNIMAATNGISCANMALAGYDHVIPFDEVIDAMDQVGRAIPHELRCTALGGLSITQTSKKIEKMLSQQE